MTTVIISNVLGPLWATEEQLAELTDEQIVELVREDLIEFADGAKWEVKREVA